MMIHLDSSFLVRALVAHTRHEAQLLAWLDEGEDLVMSAVAWAEFLCGPLGAREREVAGLLLGAPVPFEGEDGALAALLFHETGRRKRSLPDCMIAATALRFQSPLATANPADFRRFAPRGLRLADL